MKRKETTYIVIHRAEVDFDQYHAVVHRDGSVWLNPCGLDAHGSAVRNFNSVACSVAIEGDFCDADAARAKHNTPTPEQWDAAVKFIAKLAGLFPQAKLVGHTELGPGATMYVEKLRPESSCPGRRFDLDRFRLEVKQAVSAQNRG